MCDVKWCILGALLIPLSIGGCSVSTSADPNADGEQLVQLYLYPQSESAIPPQVVFDATLEANRSGIISMDTGSLVRGTLVVDMQLDSGEWAKIPVEGSVEAVLNGTTLAFDASTIIDESEEGGPYFEMVVPTGYYTINVTPAQSDPPLPRQTFRDVYLSSRTEIEGLELVLDAGRELELFLSDADGWPLSGARVFSTDPETGAYTSSPSAEIEEGRYVVTIASGTQDVWLGQDSSEETPLPIHTMYLTSIEVGADALPPMNFTYPTAAHVVNGRVTDGLGKGISSVTIYATRHADGLSGEYKTQFATDADGNYSLVLPDGTYDLVCRPASSDPLSGAVVSDVEVVDDMDVDTIVLEPKSSLRVSVVDPDSQPVEGASVVMIPTDRANPSTSTITGEDGIALAQIGEGSWLIEVDPPEGSLLARSVVSHDVHSAEEELIIELAEGFRSQLTFQADDARMEGLSVQIWAASGEEPPTASPVNLLWTGVTDINGVVEPVLAVR